MNVSTEYDERYLYRVDQYDNGQISCFDGDGEYANPKYHLAASDSRIFGSWDDAMEHIRKTVADDAENGDIHHFIVKKIEIGGSPSWGVTEWLLDNHGMLLDVAGRGGVTDCVRFHPGDIVELITINLQEKYAALSIVIKEPTSEDACYHVVTAPGVKPERVDSLRLMSPLFPISDNLKEYFQKCYDTANENYEPKEKPPFPYGFDLAGFGELSICIDVDPKTETPHLHIVDKHCSFVVNLRLDQPEYFTDNAPSDKLQPYQARELMEYLTENINGKTRWWYMLRRFREWYDDYNINLSLDTPLPDYSQLID